MHGVKTAIHSFDNNPRLRMAALKSTKYTVYNLNDVICQLL